MGELKDGGNPKANLTVRNRKLTYSDELRGEDLLVKREKNRGQGGEVLK